MIQTLEIQNFKSIRHLRLDCRRVNLFIGEPNTGKSNILEALGLFSIPHTWEIRDFVRMESMDDLFYEHDISQEVLIRYNGGESAEISLVADQQTFPPQFRLLNPWGLIVYHSDGSIVGREEPRRVEAPPLKVRFYRFSPGVVFGGQPAPFLLPPRGENLPQVLLLRKDLHRMASGFFKRFGLTLLVSLRRDKLEMMWEREGEFVTFPYSLASDTLQRQIFHLVAMETNQDAVLIFEEPEAHAFPLYTKYLGEDRSGRIQPIFYLHPQSVFPDPAGGKNTPYRNPGLRHTPAGWSDPGASFSGGRTAGTVGPGIWSFLQPEPLCRGTSTGMIGIECNADEVLLKTLGIPGKNLRHAQGKGQVFNYVERGIVSLGLVDEDPESLYTLPKLLRSRQPEELPWGLKVYRGAQKGKRVTTYPAGLPQCAD